MKKTRFHDERGATAVLMAFGIVGLLAFGGLVLDGGNAFAQRRQMQNAADASATAGANELYRYKNGEIGTNIYAKALSVAESNGASSATFTCDLVLYSEGDETGTTPCQNASNPDKDAAWKVRVNVDSTHDTTLMQVVDIHSFKAGAGAAAALLEGIGGQSPFMLCAAPGAVQPPLLEIDITPPIDPTGYEIVTNPDPTGSVYDIWRNDVKNSSDCGINNKSFRGLVDDDDTYELPGDWTYKPGNTSGKQVEPTLIGGCGLPAGTKVMEIPEGCEFLVPLCVYATADRTAMHCVKLGRFLTVKTGKGLEGEFLGGGLLPDGEAGGIPTSFNGLIIIKLVE